MLPVLGTPGRRSRGVTDHSVVLLTGSSPAATFAEGSKCLEHLFGWTDSINDGWVILLMQWRNVLGHWLVLEHWLVLDVQEGSPRSPVGGEMTHVNSLHNLTPLATRQPRNALRGASAAAMAHVSNCLVDLDRRPKLGVIQ